MGIQLTETLNDIHYPITNQAAPNCFVTFMKLSFRRYQPAGWTTGSFHIKQQSQQMQISPKEGRKEEENRRWMEARYICTKEKECAMGEEGRGSSSSSTVTHLSDCNLKTEEFERLEHGIGSQQLDWETFCRI